MRPEDIEEAIDLLNQQRTAGLESFFRTHGLAQAFNRPSEGWGRERRINEALGEAESRGIRDAVLQAALTRFGSREAASDSTPHEQSDPEHLLQGLLGEANALDVADIEVAETLTSRARMIVGQLFGVSNYSARLDNIQFRTGAMRQRLDRVTGAELWAESRRQLVAVLQTALEHVQLFGLPQNANERPRAGTARESTAAPDRRRVLVVHGRDSEVKAAMFDFLRSINLSPIEWSQARMETGKASPYVGEILDAAFNMAHAAVILMTPDDEARLREMFREEDDPPLETEFTPQARPNVLFEAGMSMATFRDRTVLIQFGNARPFSDIGGIHIVRFDDSTEVRQEIAQRLSSAECEVFLTGTSWHTAGNFPKR